MEVASEDSADSDREDRAAARHHRLVCRYHLIRPAKSCQYMDYIVDPVEACDWWLETRSFCTVIPKRFPDIWREEPGPEVYGLAVALRCDERGLVI